MTAMEALASGDFDEALRLLLAMWDQHRSPGLAALIEDVSTHVTKLLAPIEHGEGPAYIAGWTAIARERKPSDVGRLLAAISFPAYDATAIITQAEELATLAPDPRVAAMLVRLVEPEALRIGGSASSKVFTRATRGLEGHADPRLGQRIESISRAAYYSRTPHARKLEAIATAWRKRWKTAPSEPSELPMLRAVQLPDAIATVAKPPRSAETLLVEIYANPADDAPRMVYADLLAQRGDPRGEFITLQLASAAGRGTAAGDKRMAGLLREHRAAWLGALAGSVVAGRTEWARGFPVATSSSVARLASADAAFGREEWGTLERIKFGTVCHLTETMRGLRSASGVTEAALRKLGAIAPPLEELELELDSGRELRTSQPTIALVLARFPKLRALTLFSGSWRKGEALPAFVAAVVPRLSHVAVHGGGIPDAAVTAVLEADASGLASFGWGLPGRLFVARRDDTGRLSTSTKA